MASLPTDPMPRSPLVAAAATDRPSFTLYYQQADGAVQEIFYDSSSGAWRNSSTAFADAKNHTGLAAFDLVDGGEENVGASFDGPSHRRLSLRD